MYNYSQETSVWTRDSDASTAICPFAKKYCTHLCALAVVDPYIEDETVWYCGLIANSNGVKIVKYVK